MGVDARGGLGMTSRSDAGSLVTNQSTRGPDVRASRGALSRCQAGSH